MNPQPFRDGLILICGILGGLYLHDAVGKTSDERKWERIQAHREARRVEERQFESCLSRCRQSCLSK